VQRTNVAATRDQPTRRIHIERRAITVLQGQAERIVIGPIDFFPSNEFDLMISLFELM
jgi:hypothetical protein